jgi:hypothetical protein
MRKGLGDCVAALLLLIVLTMAVPQKASAYVDPGAGAMLWQIAAAAVIGSLFYVRRTIRWIRERLGMRSAGAMGFSFAGPPNLTATQRPRPTDRPGSAEANPDSGGHRP